MSYNDPYRRDRDTRDDSRGGRGGRGGYGGGGRGGGYGGPGRDERSYRDDYSGGGGGRGRPHYEDDGRDAKRGRYEDYDRGRNDTHSSFPPPSHHQGYPSAPGYPPQHPQHQQQQYGQSTYPDPYAQPAAPQHEVAPVGRKPVKPEAPSASVILLGLPERVNDTTLRQFLEDMGASIDSTTVIMDRTTGVSKRFGFAKFSSVEHARAFIEPNFPSIPWRERGGPGPDDGMRIKVNYSQKSGGWREDQGANARLTDDQRAAEGSATQSFYINDGTRDIGSTPSQILLLRGLDPLTNEEDIVASLGRVGGRANHEIAKGGIKKVYIAKDRASRSSWGFAFVRFGDVRLASDVLGAVFSPQFHPTGFRIRTTVAAASFSHENSFIPIYADSPWAFTSEGGQRLAYWDDKGFVQPWTPPPPQVLPSNIPKAPRAQEEARVDADMAAFFDSLGEEPPSESTTTLPAAAITAAPALAAPPAPLAAPSAPPAPSPTLPPSAPASSALLPGGSLAPITIKPIASLPTASVAVPTGPRESTVPPTSILAVVSAVVAAPLGGKEKKSDLIVSRKAAGSIAKWNNKAQELRRVAPAAAPPSAINPVLTPASAQAASAQPQPPVASSSTPPAADVVAYDDPAYEHGDPISFTCLLCSRQFKALGELSKHNKLSQLHKTNLANPETVATCTTRKAASLKKHAAAATAAAAAVAAAATSTTSTTDSKPKYVDRAAARREALGQNDADHGGKGKKKGAVPVREPSPEQPNQDGLEESNAGRKMLEKMGWSAGGGLGAAGDGRVDPVQAAKFQQGAGLGSSKGVAVGSDDKMTFAEKAREKAFARYNDV